MAGLGIGGLAYSGFPKRVGLTKAQALVSMPGDLVLPAAQVQVDRAITVDAHPQSVWPYVIQLRHDYRKDLWDVPVETEVVVEPELVVWKTGRPAHEKDLDLFEASAAIMLEPTADGTTRIHVRERYQYFNKKGRAAVAVVTTVGALTIYSRLRKIAAAAKDIAGGVGKPSNPMF